VALPLVLTPGDPAGIGPEVTWKALQVLDLDVVIIGADVLAGELPRVDAVRRDHSGVALLVPPEGAEPVEVRALRLAATACLDHRARALVTGPIHKARLRAQGFRFSGHTDFLGHLCGGAEPVMAFAGGDLRVSLVTTHLPLSQVPAAVTRERVRYTVETTAAALRDQLGLPAPTLVVCGLNPHAGEEGMLGTEEREIIGPACDDARAAGWDVIGPLGSETAFRLAGDGHVDGVVAMYHDQGLAPLKLVDFGRSVNWTLGLPLVRTSVDHGTADDIAGQGIADPASMVAAVRLALQVS
jgi:4-hydroxythreonine-4-phosphate dehydrogenase